jgi:catechol 2,3-dioxygenase-like lactoylglutathione lyase family enzyme
MIPVRDLDAAKKFYGETLGLPQVEENPGGVMYRSGEGKMFVYPTPMAGTAKSTAATWMVADLKSVVEELQTKGMQFEHYEFPDVEYDGPIHIMGEMKAAWFKDPEGNILGLTTAS